MESYPAGCVIVSGLSIQRGWHHRPRCAEQDHLRVEAEASPMRKDARGQDPPGGPPRRPRLKNAHYSLISVSIRACARGVTKSGCLSIHLLSQSILISSVRSNCALARVCSDQCERTQISLALGFKRGTVIIAPHASHRLIQQSKERGVMNDSFTPRSLHHPTRVWGDDDL